MQIHQELSFSFVRDEEELRRKKNRKNKKKMKKSKEK